MIRLALLLFPLAEIAGFIIVGKAIGLVPTLGLVLLGVVLGALLIRQAGFSVFREARVEMSMGRDPGPRITQGFLSLLAGLLLMAPGFLSDALGLLLLLPPVRNRAWSFVRRHVRFASASSPRPEPRPPVIELDRADYVSRPDPSSPWAARQDGRGEN